MQLVHVPSIFLMIIQQKYYNYHSHSSNAGYTYQPIHILLDEPIPIVSTNYLSRAQVDLIDMRDLNHEANMSQDGVTPYRFLMVYLSHSTKKTNLTPLKRKSAEEVTEALLDIFCESGPQHILHSDNGREFSNQLLFTTWPKGYLQ